MKKNNSILYFGVFFAASVLAEVYCIVHKINLIGVSIVIVIATYLLLDAIRSEKARQDEKLEQFFGERWNEMEKLERSFGEHLKEIEKVHKALYVQLKRNAEETKEQFEVSEKNRQTQANSMVEGQNKTAKIIIKYVREDIKKASAINKVSCEKIASAVNQGTEKLVETVGKDSFDRSLLQNIDANFSRLTEIMEVQAEDSVAEKSVGQDETKEYDMTEELETVKEQPVSEASEIDRLDPNKQLGADEIAAMFSTLGNDGDVGEMVAEPMAEKAAAAEETPSPAPMPEIDLSDPNKQLSAEEIAALFASMG